MASFKDKVIAITGAAGGMGSATAHLLASKGAKLSLADMDAVALDHLAQDIRSKYKTSVLETQVDVRDSEQVNKWIESTVTHYSILSGAANMAGTLGKEFGRKPAHQITDQDFDFVMAVNVRGIMACQRAELQHIEEGGSIVNISSTAGLVAIHNGLSYTASKHAVIGISKTAAVENGHRNVRVNVIAPGGVDTNMLATARELALPTSNEKVAPMGRVGRPEEIAALVVFLLSDDSSYITGAVHTIDGGLTL